MRPVVVDLFSGAGGLSLGFESAGFDVVTAVEYDPVHAATHLYNFPLTDVIARDINDVTKADLEASIRRGFALHNPGVEWDGQVHAVVGGPSCQGFSVMGTQSTDDDRNQLVLQFVRVVEELRPLTFCMENVPGFLDSKFSGVRDAALARLRSAGYKISGEASPLSADDYGVPQRRRRVVILGSLGEHAPAIPTPLDSEKFNVGDAFAGLPLTSQMSYDSDTVVGLNQDRQVSNAYQTFAGTYSNGRSGYGHPRQSDASSISGCRLTNHSQATQQRFDETKAGTKEPISRFFRLDITGQALTLRAGTGRERGSFSAARPIHPTEGRVITVREAARLHSFPDWFRFHTTNWHGHRQIGNAVPPLLGRAAANSLMNALALSPAESDLAPIELGDEGLLSLSPSAAARRFDAPIDQVPMRKRKSESRVAA